MVTVLGARIRELRVEKDVLLKDVAKAMGVTVAYLSGIETGKKKPSPLFLERLAQYFGLSEAEARDLDSLAFKVAKEVKIRVDLADAKSRELVASFARRFASLTDEEKDRIAGVLRRE